MIIISGNTTFSSSVRINFSSYFTLDDYPTDIYRAYSVRKLKQSYSGSALRVRRNSDNSEQDIGFVNNLLDTSSLLSFCGSGSGFVSVFYEQAGGTAHLFQTSAGAQPRIVDNGTLQTLPGTSYPCIYLQANDIGMGITGTMQLPATSTNMLFLVGAIGTSGSSEGNLIQTVNRNRFIGRFGPGITSTSISSTPPSGYYKNLTGFTGTTIGEYYDFLGQENAEIITVEELTAEGYSDIGGQFNRWRQYYSELLFYNSNVNGRDNVINSINDYYGVF